MTLGVLYFASAAGLLGTSAFHSLRRRNPSCIVLAALSFYGIVGAVSAGTITNEFGLPAFERSAFIFLTSSLLLIGGLTLARGFWASVLGNGELRDWSLDDHRRYAVFGGVMVGAGLVLIAADRPDLLIDWSQARRSNGLMSGIATFLLLMGIPSVASALASRRFTLALLTGLASLASIQLLGSRVVGMSAVMLGMWLMLTRIKSSVLQALIMAVGVPFAFLLHVMLRFVRGVGPSNMMQLIQNHTLTASIGQYLGSGADPSGGEFAITQYFVYATRVANDREFGFATTMTRIITMPLPSSNGLLSKPQDVTYRLWGRALYDGLFDNSQGVEFLHQNYQEGLLGSLHATLFGELFVSGGWASLCLSLPFLCIVITFVDALLSRSRPLESLILIGGVMAGYLFVARGNSVIGLGYFVYPLLVLKVVRAMRGPLSSLVPVPGRTRL